jgi:hypothetical protein
MAVDNDDNEVDGNGVTSDDDGYVNIIIFKLIIANLFTVSFRCGAPIFNA